MIIHPNSGAGNEEDDLLIAAVHRGEHDAFAGLLDRHLPAVRAFLALKAPVSHLVDEIAHETFVFAYKHLAEFQIGTSFRAWLRAIAWNLLRAEVQRFSRQEANLAKLAAFKSESGDAFDPALPNEADYLEHCLGEVPSEFNQLLALKYREGFSSEEIARQAQRSLAWVRTTLFRVRQQLRRCIEGKIASQKVC